MGLVAVGQHLDEELGVHFEHLALDVHVVVQVIVALLAKLDLFKVDFDTDITHIDILKRQVLLETERAFICDISERIQQFLGPVFKQWDLRQKCLMQVSHQLLERLAFFDLKEVLIVLWITHVVEA